MSQNPDVPTPFSFRVPVSRLLLRGLALHSRPEMRLSLIEKSMHGKIKRKIQIRGKNGKLFLRTYYINPEDEKKQVSLFGGHEGIGGRPAAPTELPKLQRAASEKPYILAPKVPKVAVPKADSVPAPPKTLSLFDEVNTPEPAPKPASAPSNGVPRNLNMFADTAPVAKTPPPAASGVPSLPTQTRTHHNGLNEFASDVAPHLMSRREFSDTHFGLQLPHKRDFLGGVHHRKFVEQALKAGQEVPEGVLRDYPELAKQAQSAKLDAPSTAVKPTEKPVEKPKAAPKKPNVNAPEASDLATELTTEPANEPSANPETSPDTSSDSGTEPSRPVRGANSGDSRGSEPAGGRAATPERATGNAASGTEPERSGELSDAGQGGDAGHGSDDLGGKDVPSRVPRRPRVKAESAKEPKPEPKTEFKAPVKPLPTAPPSDGNPGDLRLSLDDGIGKGSLNQKFDDNITAIETLHRIESQNRLATDEEKRVLAKYVGWGGFGNSFHSKWNPYAHYKSLDDLSFYDKRYMSDTDKAHLGRYLKLKSLLSEEEFKNAASSTLNAHYTDPHLIDAVWGAVRHLGFKGGSVLEPAAGVGHFLGFMPDDLTRQSKRTAVELDSLSGRMLRLIYPHANVHIKGFQDAPLSDESFDLAISNIPFGGYGVNDPHFAATGRKALTGKIHDYFFAKTLDKVRPGGLVAFVTSKGTLDKMDSKVRDYLAREAHFVGAVRLPNTAFSGNAATSVTTDIIFLRKKDPVNDALFESLHPRDSMGRFIEKWTQTVTVEAPRGGNYNVGVKEKIAVNEYFVSHPQMMLGEMGIGSGYGLREDSTGMKPRADLDTPEKLATALASALQTMPADVMSLPSEVGNARIVEAAQTQFQRAAEYHKPLAFLHHRNSLEEDEVLRVHVPRVIDKDGKRTTHGHLYSFDELESERQRIHDDEEKNAFQYKAELQKGIDGLMYSQGILRGYVLKGSAGKKTRSAVFEQPVGPEGIAKLIGEDLARRLLASPTDQLTREDLLKVGGVFDGYHLGGGIRLPAYQSPQDEYLLRHLGHLFGPDGKIGGATRSRIASMARLRDDAHDLIARMYDPAATEKDLEPLRSRLKRSYEAFSKSYGLLNDDVNIRLYRSDPDAGLLRALENVERVKQANPKTKSGFGKAKPVLRGLADIFTKRTVTPIVRASSAETPEDAMMISLNECGVLDWERMGELLGREPASVLTELSSRGLVYLDPAKVQDDRTSGFVVADEFLSGNVKKKLKDTQLYLDDAQSQLEQAQRLLGAPLGDGETQEKREESVQYHHGQVNTIRRSLEALQTVIPADLPPSKIDAKLGATWIPASDIDAFLRHICGLKPKSVHSPSLVSYSRGRNKWEVETYPQYGSDHLKMTSEFGTKRLSAAELVKCALNLKDPVVTDTVDKQPIVNEKETVAAKEKLSVIREEFRKWLWTDPDRAERLLRVYNDTFNHTIERDWNGSHLTLPGMAPQHRATCYDHQLNMIWRNIQQGRTLTDHSVGAGKTREAIGTCMEFRRLGLAKKPMVAVPNHMLAQWDAEFRATYPGAKVLTVWAKDWTPDTRRMKTDQIATGDWDAVLITHKAFEQLPVSEESYQAYLDKEMDAAQYELDRLDAEAQTTGSKHKSKDWKELETIINNFRSKVEARMDEVRTGKDNSLKWEELGVDHLIVDESDAFKNLWFVSKLRNVKGLPRSESARSMDMFIKSRHILQKNRNRGLGFMTGTPISNSMSEMYTLQRYLGESEMEEAGIGSFDEWASNFTEPKTEQEYTVEGTYRDVTRLAKWSNRRALFSMYRNFTDVKTREDLPYLPIPPHKHEVSTEKAGVWMPLFMDDIRKRATAIRNRRDENGREITPDIDNFLKLTTDARKAALDPRLVDPNAPDEAGSKINRCVANVMEVYHGSGEHKGTQLIFADLGTPKAESKKAAPKVEVKEADEEADDSNGLEESGESEVINEEEAKSQHSVYADIKAKLIAAGIPEREIAFAHEFDTDAKKLQRNERMNSGDLRVLIGSTEKMGAGLNVQQKLRALHHLDCPWRPRDLEQREGRIIRQGNEIYNMANEHLISSGFKFEDIDFSHPEQSKLLADAGLQARIFRYVTKGTLDEYLWQTVKEKSDYIAKAKKGLDLDVEMDDIDPVTADYSAVMGAASDNPLVKEKGEVWRELKRLYALRDSHMDDMYRHSVTLRDMPRNVAHHEKKATENEALADVLEAASKTWESKKPPHFSMHVGDRHIDGAKEPGKARESAGTALLLAHMQKVRNEAPETSVKAGKYGPFDVHVVKHKVDMDRFVGHIHDENGNHIGSFEAGNTPASTTTKMDNALRELQGRALYLRNDADDHRRQAKTLRDNEERLRELSTAPFPHEQTLKEKQARMTEIEYKLSGEEERRNAADSALLESLEREQTARASQIEADEKRSTEIGHRLSALRNEIPASMSNDDLFEKLVRERGDLNAELHRINTLRPTRAKEQAEGEKKLAELRAKGSPTAGAAPESSGGAKGVVQAISKAIGRVLPSRPAEPAKAPQDFDSPGYFQWGTEVLARRVNRNEMAQFWNGEGWVPLGREADFRRHATRITPKQAEVIAKSLGVTGEF